MNKLTMMIGVAADLTAKAFATVAVVGAMLPLSAMADAVRVYDVDDYVQDGLVGHFDGIRNAGATEAHNPTATTWKNLVPGQPDATFNTANGNWTDNAFNFTGDVHATIESPGIDVEGSNLSIQIATVVDCMAQPFVAGGKYYAIFFGNNSNDTDIFINNNSAVSSVLQFNADTFGTRSNRPSLTSWDGQYATAILGDGISYLVQGTTLTGGKTRTNTTIPARNFTWGGQAGNSKYYSKGTFHSVRIYKKALTEAELVQNRVVDEARYRNEASKGKGNDDVNVIVTSNVEGVEGTEESGKWYIAEGTHTFTASATTVVGAKFYTLDGYTVETWDGSAWGAAVTNSGASYTASSSATVRLTWLWTLTLRGAMAYDVDDYVQDGLAAHFDGIRNAGATEAHNPTATTWKNLVDGGADAAFNSDGPVWTNSAGCYFNNNGAAYITEELDLGTNFTIQLATDIDLDSQYVGPTSGGWNRYRNYFNAQSGNVNGLWTNNGDDASKKLVGNFNNYASGTVRPTINTWGGKYVTKMLSQNGRAYCFEGDSLPSGTVIAITTLPPAQTYSWGGLTNDTSKGYSVCGTFYSVRLYTNVLDNAQLAQNRRVDEIRFRGNGDVTVVNGAIGDTGANGESSLTDGVYNIETGAWTITASEIKSGGHTYLPKLLVEQYNATSGEWEATTAKPQWANSCTVDKSTLGNGRIRLTWTWQIRKGLIISFF